MKIVRAAVVFCLVTVALTQRWETQVETEVLKILRFSFGVTRMDRLRIKGTEEIGCF